MRSLPPRIDSLASCSNSGESWINWLVSTSERMPTGMLMKNTQRHE